MGSASHKNPLITMVIPAVLLRVYNHSCVYRRLLSLLTWMLSLSFGTLKPPASPVSSTLEFCYCDVYICSLLNNRHSCSYLNTFYCLSLCMSISSKSYVGSSIAQSVVRLTMNTTHQVRSSWRSEIFQPMPTQHVTNE